MTTRATWDAKREEVLDEITNFYDDTDTALRALAVNAITTRLYGDRPPPPRPDIDVKLDDGKVLSISVRGAVDAPFVAIDHPFQTSHLSADDADAAIKALTECLEWVQEYGPA